MKTTLLLPLNNVFFKRQSIQFIKQTRNGPSGNVRYFSVLDDMIAQKQLHFITMPSLTESNEGHVSKWTKQVGEGFSGNDIVCEIVFPEFAIGFDPKYDGVLAKIIAKEGQIVQVNTPIAAYAVSQEAYQQYLEKLQEETKKEEEAKERESKPKKPDALMLLKQIKNLINSGDVEDGSEFAKDLQSLARKGNESLIAAFEASFDDANYDPKTFDKKFFIENARAIVSETRSAA